MKRFNLRQSLSLIAMLGVLAFSHQAMAHAHLKTANPAEDAEVAAPDRLALTFTEGLELAFSGIELSDGDGNAVVLGNATLENDDMTPTAPVETPLEPGRYDVKWHVLSVDGHKTEGDYAFVVAP
ncbi:copper homeostasis periplasmic binding protein CopC [Salinicola salarius]|uniref:copper homeostasis periplasmic binding protein CopC n=1 Tax=Salinicola salarius TaxID=430457 RepID=UPI0023E41EA3|nr:copper homeostasis periplasmic binding protein CopC [Salinicola salarius]MDF3917869.1 copper homeostasis periplasmic binding protein CopC [Salinicola salarius]